MCWLFILKPEITGKHTEKRMKQQLTENQKNIKSFKNHKCQSCQFHLTYVLNAVIKKLYNFDGC